MWLRAGAVVLLLLCSETNAISWQLEDENIDPIQNNPTMTEFGNVLIEGDMVLDDYSRSAIAGEKRRWPLEIKYKLSEDSEKHRAMIERSLQHVENNTCLTFTEVPFDFDVNGPHISYIMAHGCWSFVGMLHRNGQNISLGVGCSYNGAVHELLHTLGVFHEHARSDRDQFVSINIEPVAKPKRPNFTIRARDVNYSVPYDYTSVMHYGRYFFSSTGQPTIRARNVLYESKLGAGSRPGGGLSHNDKQLLHLMYECNSHCLPEDGECYNNGFLNSTCQCVCPRGTSGERCEEVTGMYYPEVCHSDVTEPGTIASPSYPTHQVNDICYYLIKAPEGQKVSLTFTDVGLKPRGSHDKCRGNWVQVRVDSEDMLSDGEIGCGEEFLNRNFQSTGNEMLVKYFSKLTRFRGFQADVSFVP